MAGKLDGKTIAFLCHRGRRAGGADRALEGGGGRGRHARADLARVGEVQAFNHLDKADTFPVDHTAAEADARATTGSCCPAASPTPTSCAPTRTRSRSCARSSTRPSRSAAICHGPWTLVEAGVAEGPHADLVAVAADRPAQRGRQLGRRGGPRRRGPRDLAQARTTCPPSAPSSSRSSARASTRAARSAPARR